MSDQEIYQTLRNIILNSHFAPEEFQTVLECIVFLDERIAEQPNPEAEEKPKRRRRRGTK